MSRLRTVEQIVRPILANSQEARSDDMILYLMVCKDCILHEHGMGKIYLEDIMRYHREMNIPCFESVRRVRQKIQAADPELGCSPAVRRARHKAQKEYKDYALSKDKGGVTDGKG